MQHEQYSRERKSWQKSSFLTIVHTRCRGLRQESDTTEIISIEFGLYFPDAERSLSRCKFPPNNVCAVPTEYSTLPDEGDRNFRHILPSYDLRGGREMGWKNPGERREDERRRGGGDSGGGDKGAKREKERKEKSGEKRNGEEQGNNEKRGNGEWR